MNMAFAILLGCASSAIDAEQLKSSAFIIQGALDSRQRLMTGVCRIRGTNKTKRPGSETVTEEPVDCYCAFDYEKGLYRFDRNAPPQDGLTRGGKFIRTPSHIYEMLQTDSARAITRNRSDADPQGAIAPFDIRCVGLFSFSGPYWKLTHEEYLPPRNKKTRLVECCEESDDLYRLTWETAGTKGSTKSSMWIDAARGYSWIRYGWAYVDGEVSTKITMETSWDEIGGTWVPISLRLTDDQFGNHTEAEWTIDWESVNEPVDEENFKPENLKPAQQLALYDDSLDEPVFLGTIGAGHSVLELEEKPTKWLRIISVIVGPVILSVALIIALYWRRRPRRT